MKTQTTPPYSKLRVPSFSRKPACMTHQWVHLSRLVGKPKAAKLMNQFALSGMKPLRSFVHQGLICKNCGKLSASAHQLNLESLN
ncbi:MAG: hypothetical protein CMP10_16060 [Zetaproteobacteria bacterium]|nr:hypothetical protein [Pseudobdellovibrionaceae bacterium]